MPKALSRLRAKAAPAGPPAPRRPGEKPDKGLYGGSCNRLACQAPGEHRA